MKLQLKMIEGKKFWNPSIEIPNDATELHTPKSMSLLFLRHTRMHSSLENQIKSQQPLKVSKHNTTIEKPNEIRNGY